MVLTVCHRIGLDLPHMHRMIRKNTVKLEKTIYKGALCTSLDL